MEKTDTLLRLPEVEAIVGLKKSKIYSLITEGKFPAATRLGKRAVRWKASSVRSWIESLTSADQKEAA